MEPFGHTRSSVQSDHALITPDTHVATPLVGWSDASAVVHVSPDMGAGFLLYTVDLEPSASSAEPPPDVERFLFVRKGTIQLEIDGNAGHELRSGGYAYLPADMPHEIKANSPAKLAIFEKDYHPLMIDSEPEVEPLLGKESDIDAEPFLGDPDARLRTLLPERPAFDMAVNIFTFQPGATLPRVEIHVMEHGLLMLEGAGIYRLGERWYPVAAGDVIWMASYCPQWFVAMGKQPARYLYYKDIHREPPTA